MGEKETIWKGNSMSDQRIFWNRDRGLGDLIISSPFILLIFMLFGSCISRAVHSASYVQIADWAIDDAPWCIHFSCVSFPSDVPSGTAYFTLHGPFLTDGETVDFSFPSPVDSVSMLTTAVGSITATGFDSGGSQIVQDTIIRTMIGGWGTNVLSLEATGIKSISIAGDFAVIDNLTFGGTVEDFEGYVSGPNIEMPFIPPNNTDGFLAPGIDGEFTFSSGMVLTAPIPNPIATIPVPEPSGLIIALFAIMYPLRLCHSELRRSFTH